MSFLIEYSVFLAMPVVALHLALDLYDKHRHGIKVHDAVGVLAYIVLAAHITLDLIGVAT